MTTESNAPNPSAKEQGNGSLVAGRDVDVDAGGQNVERSKFDLGAPDPLTEAGDIPWSYAENRMTALVRDPDSMYLYWEITEDGLHEARSRLGAGAESSWCNLRVYDTTGRAFDGTNANDYFDIRVDRLDRHYFLMLHRPTSAHHVEVGMRSPEGFFQPVARSGRADFPRKNPSLNGTLEWLTVATEGAHPAAAPYESRFPGPEPPLPQRPGGQPAAIDTWRSGGPTVETTWVRQPETIWQAGEKHETKHETSWVTTHHTHEFHAWAEWPWKTQDWRVEWRGPLRFTRWVGETAETHWIGPVESFSWQSGPFPIDMLDPTRVEIQFSGESPFVLQGQEAQFSVYGPWKVTIKSFGGIERRVLGEWTVHWVQATTPMIERWGTVMERRFLNAFSREEFAMGASEIFRKSEGGASEIWRIGGSERMWLGASEWRALGATETLFLGGTETAYLGASALLMRGASQWQWVGASEWQALASSQWQLGGASETTWRGASEIMAIGASEFWALGGSEVWLGSSLGGASDYWLGASEMMSGASEMLGSSNRIPIFSLVEGEGTGGYGKDGQ